MPVEFPEEKFGNNDNYVIKKTPTMVKWVIKIGIVKDEKQANIVLIILAVIFLGLAVYIFANTGSKPTATAGVLYREDLSEEDLQNLPPEILESIPSRYDTQ